MFNAMSGKIKTNEDFSSAILVLIGNEFCLFTADSDASQG